MKLLAFDVDGTLLDTVKPITYHVNKTLDKHNFEKIDDYEFMRRILGYGSYYLIEESIKYHRPDFDDKVKIQEVLDDYLESYNADPAYLTEAYDGVENLIRDLKEEGYTIVAYSNKPDDVLQELMKEIFDVSLFSHIEGQKPGAPSKPHPKVLNAIMDKFGVEKEETAYIGDSDVDVETAKNAGVISLAVTWGFRDRDLLEDLNPDYLADNTKEVKVIIDSLRG